MSFWDKNIEALNKTQPVLVKKLHEHKDDIPSSEAVHTIQAKDGNQALVLTVEGKDYVMNSRFRPIQEAVTYAEQFKDIKDYSVGIFFGFGNGMFAREIQKYGDMHVRYVYYEPSVESFLFGMHEYDWTDIWQKERTLIYVEGINEKDIRLDLSSWIDWSNMPLSEIYYLPKYQDIFPEIYRSTCNWSGMFSLALICPIIRLRLIHTIF